MNKTTKIAIKYSIISIISLLIGIVIIGLIVVRKEYKKFQESRTSASYTPPTLNTPTNQTKKSNESIKYDLLNGWNLIAFPNSLKNIKTAAEFIKLVSNQDGLISTVAYWDGDRWQEFTQRNIQQYGTNFNIVPGKAYFVRSHNKMSLQVELDSRQELLPIIPLSIGWNAVGIPWATDHAKDITNQINQPSVEIDWWNSGSWEVFVNRQYETTSEKDYGINYSLEPQRGYMIKVNTPTNLEVKQ